MNFNIKLAEAVIRHTEAHSGNKEAYPIDYWEAKSFIEGLNSPDVYEREDVKKLVEALNYIIFCDQTQSIRRNGICEMCRDKAREALSAIPKESEVKE